jgi:hypothetical protein
MREEKRGLSTYCSGCGKPIPPWFKDGMTDEEDDTAYERWLDTPCAHCGATPRASLPKRSDTVR